MIINDQHSKANQTQCNTIHHQMQNNDTSMQMKSQQHHLQSKSMRITLPNAVSENQSTFYECVFSIYVGSCKCMLQSVAAVSSMC